jgi:hypothetical protein
MTRLDTYNEDRVARDVVGAKRQDLSANRLARGAGREHAVSSAGKNVSILSSCNVTCWRVPSVMMVLTDEARGRPS